MKRLYTSSSAGKANDAQETGTPRAGWHVYIVRCIDDTLYTGVAVDVDGRVRTHNAGKGAKYTRARRPVELVYQEVAATRGDALRREYAIKQMPASVKRQLVRQSRPKRTRRRAAAAR